MKKMNKKGFTLIEMLVVIAIIAVLVAIIIPVVSGSTEKAKCATNAANLRSVKAEMVIKYVNNGTIDPSVANGVKFHHVNSVNDNSGFNATKEADGDIKVTWDGKSIAEWAALAGEAGVEATGGTLATTPST